MSIAITITDPSTLSETEYALVLEFVAKLREAGPKNIARGARVAPVLAPAVPIAPQDNPAAGVEVLTPAQAFAGDSPAAAFAQVDPTPAEAFAGNVTPESAQAIASSNAVASAPVQNTNNAPASSGVTLDKNGLPWDARIHAESKAIIADGTWRKKRGVDAALVTQVEAELRTLMAVPSPNVAVSPVAPAPAAPIVETTAPVSPSFAAILTANTIPDAAPVLGNVPPPPVAPVNFAGNSPATVTTVSNLGNVPPAPTSIVAPVASATVNPPSVASAAPSNFVEFIGKFAPLMAAGGKLTQDEVKAACATYGVAELHLLSNRNDLVPLVNAHLDAILATKG